MTEPSPTRDFIRQMIADDVAAGHHDGRVVTRFPPEPNGFLHIGHAKSICLNFGIAREFPNAVCHLRFDDTNPETEDEAYVRSIQEDVRWLGFDWGEHLYFASDYFEQMYAFAEHLIERGLAYVDSASEEEIRAARGTVTEPGYATPSRTRTVAENLDLFRRMRAGEFPDGAHVLRAKIDLASNNMLMRDPVLYRIRHAHHYRQGDAWCIYPLYDYAHPIEDALESVTHSLCTLEFDNNRELYDWVVANIPRGPGAVPPESEPRQTEFARLALDYTVMSKRKLLQLVNNGDVTGWDDPRMPTIAGMRRRGVTPESLRSFADLIGVAKANTRVDIAKLEYALRDDLNQHAPRVLCVLDPLRVVITNWPAGHVEEIDAPYFPHDVPREGSRTLAFTGELFIDAQDFAEDPPKGFFRLAPGREVRLRYGYIIKCAEVIKDAAGKVTELRCTYDPATRGGDTPDGRVVKGTIQWVSAHHAIPCEVRLYDRLFTVPDPEADESREFREFLNRDSLVVVKHALVEPSVRNDPPGSRYQFERLGYFCSDPVDSRADALVFNRTVTLRDTWARTSRAEPHTEKPRAPSRAPIAAPRAQEIDPARRPAIARFASEFQLDDTTAEILTRTPDTERFYRDVVAAGAAPRAAANWTVNELARELGERTLSEVEITAAEFANLLRMLDGDELNSTAAREVLNVLVNEGGIAVAIVEGRGLRQLNDTTTLSTIVEETIAAHPAKVEEYRKGRTGLLGFFVGQVMGKTRGRANPEAVSAMLAERLR